MLATYDTFVSLVPGGMFFTSEGGWLPVTPGRNRLTARRYGKDEYVGLGGGSS